jgi:AT-binding transcription factor 1
MCPLCQDSFTERKSLENHVMSAHHVNAEGLNRLLQLVDTSHWLNNKKSPTASAGDYECLVCSDTLKSMNDLLMHATDHQHFSITGMNQFCCLLKSCQQKFISELQVQQHFRTAHLNIVISERHVYKYRCPMCPLAFKTEEKLNNHFMYHTMRDATKCNICSRNFRSTTSLQRHIEQAHNTPNNDVTKPSELTDDERMQTPNDDAMSNDEEQEFEQDAKRFKSISRNEKPSTYSLEKYHDPNRPYKCEDCFESFTQANILAVHKNSVSHLHRVKKKQGETHSGSSTPALGTSPNQMGEFDRRSVDFDRKSIDFEMEISNSMESNKRKLSSDNDYDSPKKRFKCDICKVS